MAMAARSQVGMPSESTVNPGKARRLEQSRSLSSRQKGHTSITKKSEERLGAAAAVAAMYKR